MLDQFFTKPEVAEQCLDFFKETLRSDGADISEYTFVEPSAGAGAFYDLLPEGSIGLDIDTSYHKGLIEADYLYWLPPEKTKHIVIGNPPFNRQGKLCLEFLKHSLIFAEYVAFILPRRFQKLNTGGNFSKARNQRLVASLPLPASSFVEAQGGKDFKIDTAFCVFKKDLVNPYYDSYPTTNSYFHVFSSRQWDERPTLYRKLLTCDFTIGDHIFEGDFPKVFSGWYEGVEDMDSVFAIKVKREFKKMEAFILKNNWKKIYKDTSTYPGRRNGRVAEVARELCQAGFEDPPEPTLFDCNWD